MSQHGHSHNGQPCHGHGGHVAPARAHSDAPAHGHSHGGQPCHGHNQQPKAIPAHGHHGHSHNGQPCHGHGGHAQAPSQPRQPQTEFELLFILKDQLVDIALRHTEIALDAIKKNSDNAPAMAFGIAMALQEPNGPNAVKLLPILAPMQYHLTVLETLKSDDTLWRDRQIGLMTLLNLLRHDKMEIGQTMAKELAAGKLGDVAESIAFGLFTEPRCKVFATLVQAALFQAGLWARKCALPSCNVTETSEDPKKSVLKRCGGCQLVSYHSVECQKQHWADAHKAECKAAKARSAQLQLNYIQEMQKEHEAMERRAQQDHGHGHSHDGKPCHGHGGDDHEEEEEEEEEEVEEHGHGHGHAHVHGANCKH